MNNKYKVLIIEDEENITTFLSAMLETAGYQVLSAGNCESGKMMFSSHNPDIIVLDLGLPDGDGTVILDYIREISPVPVIVLSARCDESDKVDALERGANDYVTKPFGSAELVARVRNAIRNTRFFSDSQRTEFVLGDMKIDYDARRITVAGEEIRFTQTEYNILAFLSAHCGKVMTYSSIIKGIWGYIDIGSTKKLQVNMANIRKKLGAVPGQDSYIINELGVGYRMNSPKT